MNSSALSLFFSNEILVLKSLSRCIHVYIYIASCHSHWLQRLVGVLPEFVLYTPVNVVSPRMLFLGVLRNLYRVTTATRSIHTP